MTDIVERLHVAPATIWLQVDPTEEFLPDAAAWCIDKINDSDVGYVRADIIDFLHQQLAECQKEAQQWFVRMQQENDSAIALEEQLAECQAREKVLWDEINSLRKHLAESQEMVKMLRKAWASKHGVLLEEL